jgi:hypothetical protein
MRPNTWVGTPPLMPALCSSRSIGRPASFLANASTLAASGTDPQTGEALQAVVEFRVSNGAPQLPGTVVIRVDPAPIYISTVNGNRSKQVEVDVRDGGGTLVPNPAPGVDNVRLEIVGGGQGGDGAAAGVAP